MTNDVQSVPRPRASRKQRLAGLEVGLGVLALVILGWRVADIEEAVHSLTLKGVEFTKYNGWIRT